MALCSYQLRRSGETLEDDRELALINQARVQGIVRDARNIENLRLGIAGALSRLYRTRNTIVHNGEFAPYGLAAVVAAARALLSGLLDRLKMFAPSSDMVVHHRDRPQ
jgi:hypothetical protein